MRRIPELDALRGLAAVAIVFFHLWVPSWGFVSTAVDLFFVMSGFLITSIILKQLDQSSFLTTFYARRALRIWPIYYLSLIGFVVLNAFLPNPARLDALPYYLTYTQRIPFYWSGQEPPFSLCFGHSWTLAIEEQFYLIWPLVIFLLGRRSIVPAGLAMIVFAVVSRSMGYPVWILLTRGDGLALGGLLAVVLEGHETRVQPLLRGRTFALIGAGATVFLASGSSVLLWLGLSDHLGSRTTTASSFRFLAINVMYFGFVGWIVCNAGARWLAPLRDRSLCFLGKISYGIYLYHYIIFLLLDEYAGDLGLTNRYVLDLVKLALSFGLAIVSWKFIERPLLVRKESLGYSKYREPVAPVGPRSSPEPSFELGSAGVLEPMTDEGYVYTIAAVIALTVLGGVLRKSFDPFAPHWLFLVGYTQVYVVQAIMCRDWALRVRGLELVTAANARALWALLWYLLVYYCGVGKFLAARLPSPPESWSPPVIAFITPWMIVWGLISAGFVVGASGDEPPSAEGALFRSFPILMLVAGVLLIVTGRSGTRPQPVYTWIGLGVVAVYIVIWMIHGKRSPPLFGVLATICALYTSRGKRPSKLVLAVTALAGVIVVSLAIGFRGNKNYEHNLSGFVEYVSEFDLSTTLINLNVKTHHDDEIDVSPEKETHESEEYGGFLLMMDTVPARSDYDYGSPYLKLFSTYIPRIIWHNKPIYGREKWVAAWIAGSEQKRTEEFTGPAIGILGATQLNGGATATLIVLAVLGLMTRTAYEYFRRYEHVTWVQAWWAMTFFNTWLMTVNDDPFVWFYFIYGHTTVPPLAFLWFYHKRIREPR